MSATLVVSIVVAALTTSFLSGIFGMAGGMVMMGILLMLLTVPEAMALHGVSQMASNAWRGTLWISHVRWRAVGMYLAGCAVAFVIWSLLRYVPSKPIALLMLGLSPFVVHLLPPTFKPNPESLLHGLIYGASCMSLMLLTGVAGPLIDTYFLGGGFDRRQIIATKAICQVVGHGAKFAYFGVLIDPSAAVAPWLAVLVIVASMIGTLSAKPVLERLTDTQYRKWAQWIITGIACLYLVQAGYFAWKDGGFW